MRRHRESRHPRGEGATTEAAEARLDIAQRLGWAETGEKRPNLSLPLLVIWGGTLAVLGLTVASDVYPLAVVAVAAAVLSVAPGSVGLAAAPAGVFLGVVAVTLGGIESPLQFMLLLVAAAILGRLCSRSLEVPLLLSRLVSETSFPPNAFAFESRVESELSRARRHGHALTVMTIAVNTADPSVARDEVHRIAHVLTSVLRLTDSVGIDGRRLMALMPETPAEAVPAIRERVVSALELDEAAVSIGHASFPEEEVTWVGLRDLALRREQDETPKHFEPQVVDVSDRLSGERAYG